MPNNNFYQDHSYATLYDYAERENVGTVIEEMVEQSSFIASAAFKETNEGMKETFKRETERGKAGMPAAIDEGFYARKRNNPLTESEFGVMRTIDSLNWTHLQEKAVDEVPLRAKNMKDVAMGMADLRVKYMLYANSKAADADEAGTKLINGLFTYVDEITTAAQLKDMKNLYRANQIPFKIKKNNKLVDWGDRCLALSNNASSASNAEYCSVLGVAWGDQGVISVYPKDINAAGAGLKVDYRSNIRDTYQDEEGNTRHYMMDECDFEQYFGIGVKNRYCLTGLRNINLALTGDALWTEMEKVEENLTELADFFGLGKTGYNMHFYCPLELIRKMEKYQKLHFNYQRTYSEGTRDFNGRSPLLRPTTLEVAAGVVLESDPGLKLNETFIA